MVHAHFQHRHLRALRHAQNGHRQAQVIVEVSGGLAHTVTGGQDGCDHFLGGGFAHGTRDAHHLHAAVHAQVPGNVAQGFSGVLYQNMREIRLTMAAQHGGGTGGDGGGNKIMTVPLPSLEGHKQLTPLDLSGILTGTVDDDMAMRFLDLTATPLGGLL